MSPTKRPSLWAMTAPGTMALPPEGTRAFMASLSCMDSSPRVWGPRIPAGPAQPLPLQWPFGERDVLWPLGGSGLPSSWQQGQAVRAREACRVTQRIPGQVSRLARGLSKRGQSGAVIVSAAAALRLRPSQLHTQTLLGRPLPHLCGQPGGWREAADRGGPGGGQGPAGVHPRSAGGCGLLWVLGGWWGVKGGCTWDACRERISVGVRRGVQALAVGGQSSGTERGQAQGSCTVGSVHLDPQAGWGLRGGCQPLPGLCVCEGV